MSEHKKINFTGIAKGIAFSLILTFLFIFIIALVCYFCTVSEKIMSLSVFAATAISVFLGALLLAKSADGSGLVHGLILGIGYLIIMFIADFIFHKGIDISGGIVSTPVCVLASGMLGGILGINSK